ncbi:MAG: hypothetical protein KAG53_05810 [Endozoicomonadaceae bacterium]|nr:hypothetical protein [Endozoicomonadaceae bacterium]
MNRMMRPPELLPMDVVAKIMLIMASYSMRLNCVVMIQKKNSSPHQPKKETSTIKRGRKGLSKNLPRHQIHIDLSDEEKAGAIDTFYSVVKEELDIEPAKARVIEYLQEKAIFVEKGTRQIKREKLPKHPLAKVLDCSSLLSFQNTAIAYRFIVWKIFSSITAVKSRAPVWPIESSN